MVTKTVTLPARRQPRSAFRLIILALVLVAALAGAGVVLFQAAARAALPQVDGRLALRGLSAPVTVTRDSRGIPNLVATNLPDLFFAQGYVTAQDRLWQMDMTRRFAAGDLAEILGPKFVQHDRTQRILLIRQTAENAAAQLPPRDREYFEAYARGVNAYIADQWNLPIEFRVLHYKPRPWTVTDSFLVATSMVQMLNLESISHELAREKISSQLPPDLAADLFPNSSWRDHPPVNSPGQDEFIPEEPASTAQQPIAQTQPDLQEKPHEAVPGAASPATSPARERTPSSPPSSHDAQIPRTTGHPLPDGGGVVQSAEHRGAGRRPPPGNQRLCPFPRL